MMMSLPRFLVRLSASCIAFLLVLVFVIRVFAPGNPDTAAFFQLLALIQPVLDTAALILSWPVQQICQWVQHFLPTAWQGGFPVSSAAGCAQALVDGFLQLPGMMTSPLAPALLDVHYESQFPGVLDWRLLLSVAFWGWVESLFLKGLNIVDARLYRHQIRQRDEALLRSFQGGEARSEEPSVATSKNLLFNQVVRGLKNEISALNQSVNLDPLTQLFNRGYLDVYLDAELQKARWNGSALAVLLLDVDNFKQINDHYGHASGDEVLQKVASVLLNIKPPQGKAMAFRYGGEELVVVLTNTSPVEAEQVAETARVYIQKLKLDLAPEHSISASVGCCTLQFSETLAQMALTSADLLAKADALMYQAKQTGKNRVVANTFG
ncbi:GGDEF domain-containing protein [Vampirovibrio chlorellavorus]|uniref:GGDEF domain-containing protein n=1 Tax=Vampirovibrio chlorellavorus TaxID=758823 RepID=UPI0026F241F0|nr:GGDEF domain-containing protein [Vampirovibrio chlorellavorus]